MEAVISIAIQFAGFFATCYLTILVICIGVKAVESDQIDRFPSLSVIADGFVDSIKIFGALVVLFAIVAVIIAPAALALTLTRAQ